MTKSTSRLDKTFTLAKASGRKVFMPFITAGYPSLKDTAKLVAAMCRGGADIIELGVPFSDPLADGPVIQKASQAALINGTTLSKVLDLVSDMRHGSELGEVPVVLLLYYNTIYAYGPERFVADAVDCGVDGIVVPDLPYEESGELRALARSKGLAVIAIAAPTTSPERLKRILKDASGFVYYTSVTGVTGTRKALREQLSGEIVKVKHATTLPVLIGFGIANADQARQAAVISDGVIMGSSLINLVEKCAPSALQTELEEYIRAIKLSI